jgi:hypothetical protein
VMPFYLYNVEKSKYIVRIIWKGMRTENELEKTNSERSHTIYKHVPCRRGQCTGDTIKFLGNLDLAS